MFVFHVIHMMLSILFPGDLVRKLGKFVTTHHSSNSSSDCFHTVLNIPCPSIITPSIGSLFTWMAIQFCPVFGCEPLSSSFLLYFPYVPSLLIASFLPFLLITLALSVFQRLPKLYHDFLR